MYVVLDVCARVDAIMVVLVRRLRHRALIVVALGGDTRISAFTGLPIWINYWDCLTVITVATKVALRS